MGSSARSTDIEGCGNTLVFCGRPAPDIEGPHVMATISPVYTNMPLNPVLKRIKAYLLSNSDMPLGQQVASNMVRKALPVWLCLSRISRGTSHGLPSVVWDL